ncbi:putative DNA modification/repair radical SAM protein [Desulfitispora alkaliphila]
MDIHDKLKILANAAKYDVSCSSSGSSRQNKNGLGNAAASGICHSWSDDGRCISLLKILFSNYCIYDCLYCYNRTSNDIPRASFTPDELADLTINFYRRNYIEGLFLSSGVIKSPNYTMEKMVLAIKKLRNQYNFHGYIHLKAIPGADTQLLTEAGKLVDRLSCNIELPSEKSLNLLAPQKKKEAVLKPMQFIGKKKRNT